jgi:diguanylate cyclase (GGDEF)-like protein
MAILIVDDSPDNRLPLKTILRKAGYTDLLTAESAREAFRHLGMDDPVNAHHGIDVILMDIMMPEMDGIEACRRIKAVSRLRDIPVIMVTSHGESRDIEGAFNAGAMDYITKPVNVVELLARLGSALSLKREMDCRKKREDELVRLTQQLEEANQKLQCLSSVDGLTGVANRRCFDDVLLQAWRFSLRRAAPLSLIMIDIDFFKAYNDTLGHLRGDECLKQVARALGEGLHRPSDLLARYGGEEFVALLWDTDARGAAVVAGGLRARVENRQIAHGTAPCGHVTVSLGAATIVPSSHGQPAELIAAADQALYQAKREGRNQVRIAATIAHDHDGLIRHTGQPPRMGPHLAEAISPKQ